MSEIPKKKNRVIYTEGITQIDIKRRRDGEIYLKNHIERITKRELTNKITQK